MKSNFRPVFFYSKAAEANYLLRLKQYSFDKNNLSIAKVLVWNKVLNQLQALKNTRKKSKSIETAKALCKHSLEEIDSIVDYQSLMGLEGRVSKSYFSAFYEDLGWKGRYPRTKIDVINSVLDLGYTILFNYVEVFIKMFGFDSYIGVYHRLWFKRKSLVCDLMEAFRPLVDIQVRKTLHLGQIKVTDFNVSKNEYILKYEKYPDYSKIFYTVLVKNKSEFFKYMQAYYRSFMSDGAKKLPIYEL